VFNGNQSLQHEFFTRLGVTWGESWTFVDTEEAHRSWHRYVQFRRSEGAAKRPLADILIGAFASRFTGILTRNQADFQKLFPRLNIGSL
jgi:hypothetical protein